MIENAESESEQRCLVILNKRKVYDVTPFLDEHPGGGEIIRAYNGQDITEALKDPMSHLHSETAYEMLDEMYYVAILATDEEAKKILTDENRQSFSLVSSLDSYNNDGESSVKATAAGRKTVNSEAEMHITTDFDTDYSQHKFIDLSKPLFPQVFFAKYNKEFYLEQVHKPRHYGKGSAPILEISLSLCLRLLCLSFL